MVPKEHTGRGFKGVSEYILHDKKARTDVRVEWTHMENLSVDDASRAWREMARTATNAEALKWDAGVVLTGRKGQNPVYHLTLSWAKDEDPDREQMIAAGRDALKALGMENHQALFVCHNDEPQPHIHILVNRVDPANGLMNRLSRSKRKLSAWAMEYERTQGKIRCAKRLENQRALQQGEKPRHRDAVIREAWERSDSGKGFQAALAEQGYVLALGNRRIVVMDPQGKAINPARQLQGVRAADIKARLADPDLDRLPGVEAVREHQADSRRLKNEQTGAVGKEKASGQSTDRDLHNREWEQGIIDAAIAKDESRSAQEAFNRAGRGKKPEKLLGEMTRRQAVFNAGELRSALRAEGQDPALVEALERDGKILRLHERESGRATDSFTTPEVRAHEQSVLDCAERLRARQDWQVDARSREAASARRTLDAEQDAAMAQALSPAGLSLIQGRAGTGKSHTLGAVRETLEANRYRVIGLAPTNTVALDLKKNGFSEARTVHSLLWHIDRQRPEGRLDARTVLVVDEAAMLDTRITERLLGEAERGGAKVILVGDDRQLSSVGRGGMFGAIAERLGSAEITRVRRQNEAWDRQAAEAFASGRFADGVNAYERHGRIDWSLDLRRAREALVKQWRKDTAEGIGNRFVFAYTNAEVNRLNAALRQVEIDRGRVDSSRSVAVKTERFGTVELAQGDRVQFRSNDKPRGIVNGLVGTVQRAGSDGSVQVLAENGREIVFSAGDEKRPEIQHGYAGTIYRAQGRTLDDAYLLHTYHWRDRPSYVAMTRARGAARLFVAQDQARGMTALVRQMARCEDGGASLRFATAEEIRRRESGNVRTASEAFERAGREGVAQGQAPVRSPAPPPVRSPAGGTDGAGTIVREEPAVAPIDEWAGALRAELQSRQIDERGELDRKHARRRDALEEDLQAFYGPGLARDCQELGKVRDALRTALPAHRRCETEALVEAHQKGIADAENRCREARARQLAGHHREQERLHKRHVRERAAVEARIAAAQAIRVPPAAVNDNPREIADGQRPSPGRRARIEARHIEERRALDWTQQERREELAAELERRHGTRAREEALAAVRRQIEEAGVIARLSGRRKHLETSRDALERAVEQSRHEQALQREAFEKDCARERQRLQERQDEERRDFEQQRLRETFSRQQEHTQERQQTRTIDLPEHHRSLHHDLGRSR